MTTAAVHRIVITAPPERLPCAWFVPTGQRGRAMRGTAEQAARLAAPRPRPPAPPCHGEHQRERLTERVVMRYEETVTERCHRRRRKRVTAKFRFDFGARFEATTMALTSIVPL